MSVLSCDSDRGTGRKNAQSQVAGWWEATFKASLETMLDPFAIITPVRDRDGHIADFEYVYANTAMAENVHVDREALIGRRLLDVRPEHRSSGLFEIYCHALDSGEALVLDGLSCEEVSNGEVRLRWYDVFGEPGRGRTGLYLA